MCNTPARETPSRARALGFVREDLSGSRLRRDQRAVEAYAERAGLDRVHTFAPAANITVPILQLVEMAGRLEVSAIIVPSLRHVHAWRRGVTEQWTLHDVNADVVFDRGHKWPPLVEPFPRPYH